MDQMSLGEKKKKESDVRIHRLTKLWCEEIWKERYLLVAQWDGKEAKNLEKLVSYATTNFGAMRAEEKCAEAMERYLNVSDTFLTERKHPFSILYSQRSKYFVADPRPTKKIAPAPVEEVQFRKTPSTKEELIDDILTKMRFDKDYLHSLYKGVRHLKGTTPATKRLKEAVFELLDPKVREEMEESIRKADKSDVAGFTRVGRVTRTLEDVCRDVPKPASKVDKAKDMLERMK